MDFRRRTKVPHTDKQSAMDIRPAIDCSDERDWQPQKFGEIESEQFASETQQ